MVEKRKSDLSRAFSEDGEHKTHVGGQALIEGIMMRGTYNWSVAVREPTGALYVEEHDLKSGLKRHRWMGWPLVRGCRALIESLFLGFQALQIAAEHAFVQDETASGVLPQPSENEQGPKKVFSWKDDFGRPDTVVEGLGAQTHLDVVEVREASRVPSPVNKDEAAPSEERGELGKGTMLVSLVIGLVLGVALFIVGPAFITTFLVGEYDAHTLMWNIVDGLLRVVVFVFYLWLIGRMSDIKRMFAYHGAEHKTIHCYEHGLELTPENARSFPRLHVRCGTAFLIMVMLIAIIVYTITPLNGLIQAWGVPDGAPKLALVIITRILLMPVIAGVSYEITVRWAGNHPESPLVRLVLWPGMQMQYLTTNEPDDDQIECAIAAMRRVLEREEHEARTKHRHANALKKEAACTPTPA